MAILISRLTIWCSNVLLVPGNAIWHKRNSMLVYEALIVYLRRNQFQNKLTFSCIVIGVSIRMCFFFVNTSFFV